MEKKDWKLGVSKISFVNLSRKKIAPIAAIIVVILAVVIILNRKTTINLNDYVDVTFSGYNEVGKTEINNVTLNEDVVTDYWKAFGLTEEEKDEGSYYSNRDAYQFIDSISAELDKTDDLSNGDTVTVQWNAFEDDLKEVEKKLGIKLVYSDMEMTVEGLGDAQSWDPFENMECTGNGFSSKGTISIKANSEVPDLKYVIAMDLDDYESFSNGDTITIGISAPNDEDVTKYCMENGKIPTSLTKDIVVEGFDDYATDSSQISSDVLTSMRQQAEDIFTAHIASSWGDTEVLGSFTYIGNYFLTKKDSVSGDSNYIYLVYRVDVTVNGTPVTYYNYTRFDNLITGADGECTTVPIDYTTPSNTYRPVTGYFYYGYETLDDLYKDCIQKKVDNYTYEDNINE